MFITAYIGLARSADSEVPIPLNKPATPSLKPAFRLWMENSKKDMVIDQTDAFLLRHIEEERSLTKAAKKARISYRNAWDRVKEMEENLGRAVVETRVGGKTGGSTALTREGQRLLKEFRRTRGLLFDTLADLDVWEDISYKLSARNRFVGKVVGLQKGTITSAVKIQIGSPVTVTAIVTEEAVEELAIKEGDDVEAIIKSTDVFIAKKEGRKREGGSPPARNG